MPRGSSSGHKYIKRTGTPGNFQYWYLGDDGRTLVAHAHMQGKGKEDHAKRIVGNRAYDLTSSSRFNRRQAIRHVKSQTGLEHAKVERLINSIKQNGRNKLAREGERVGRHSVTGEELIEAGLHDYEEHHSGEVELDPDTSEYSTHAHVNTSYFKATEAHRERQSTHERNRPSGVRVPRAGAGRRENLPHGKVDGATFIRHTRVGLRFEHSNHGGPVTRYKILETNPTNIKFKALSGTSSGQEGTITHEFMQMEGNEFKFLGARRPREGTATPVTSTPTERYSDTNLMNVGDKFTDAQGNTWKVESINHGHGTYTISSDDGRDTMGVGIQATHSSLNRGQYNIISDTPTPTSDGRTFNVGDRVIVGSSEGTVSGVNRNNGEIKITFYAPSGTSSTQIFGPNGQDQIRNITTESTSTGRGFTPLEVDSVVRVAGGDHQGWKIKHYDEAMDRYTMTSIENPEAPVTQSRGTSFHRSIDSGDFEVVAQTGGGSIPNYEGKVLVGSGGQIFDVSITDRDGEKRYSLNRRGSGEDIRSFSPEQLHREIGSQFTIKTTQETPSPKGGPSSEGHPDPNHWSNSEQGAKMRELVDRLKSDHGIDLDAMEASSSTGSSNKSLLYVDGDIVKNGSKIPDIQKAGNIQAKRRLLNEKSDNRLVLS